MKVNLKKLGAIVAGATILASSVAFAGLSAWNTQLVDANGAPVAKVVVGANAAASDGVAAANVAAALAKEAFKMQTLTAQVAGKAVCTVGSGSSTLCAVGTPKTVQLEITVPGGVTEGSATFKTLIGDKYNRELDDRDAGQTVYNFGSSDVVDTANPFTNANSSSLHSDLSSATALNKVTGATFTPMADFSITDPDASGQTYKEVQNVWVSGNNKYSDSKDDIIADITLVSYTLKFSGATDDLGLPVCTTPTNSTLYAQCVSSGGNTDYATENHGVKIKFLGEDWVITDLAPPSTALANEQVLVKGGTVKLGKESLGGVVNQGEWLKVGDCKYVLADIVADTHEAAIDVVDANGATIAKEKIAEGTTRELTNACGTTTIKVLKTVPGYTFGAKWAKFLVLSQELELRDSAKLDPDNDANKEWKVVLGWKNKGGASTDTSPDHLRTIVLYSTDVQKLVDDDLVAGDFVPFVQSPTNWKLSFAGVDITNDNRDSLSFNLERSSDKNSLEVRNGSGSTMYCNVTSPYVRVTSGTSTAFRLTGVGPSTDEGTGNSLYVASSGLPCTNGITYAGNSVLITSGTSSTAQDVWILANNAAGAVNVSYDLAGDGDTTWASGGIVSVSNNTFMNNTQFSGVDFNGTFSGGANVRTYFGISEKAGVGVSNSYVDKMVFGLQNSSTASSWTFNFDLTTNVTDTLKKDKVRYIFAGPVSSGVATAEEGTITERGSVYESTDDTKVEFSIAKKLGRAAFTLATTAASTAAPGTLSKVLSEGDSYTTSNGVKIKVAQINCNAVVAGSTGTGAAPACSVDETGLSAVIMPQNAASVQAALPYSGSVSNLVVLDREAASVGTLITVGGPAVNSVTKDVLQGSDVASPASWPNNKLVKEIAPGKIVCAGVNADDTLAACQDLVSQLKRQ